MSIKFDELRGDLVYAMLVAGQPTAGTPHEFELFVAPYDLEITRVQWVPRANITANGTNFFTLSLRNRGDDASGTAVAASRSYAATNSVAHVPEDVALSGTVADRQVAAGELITAEKLVSGTGLAMPDGLIQVTYRIA